MHAISDAELLRVWERGLGQGAAQRALSLLAATCSETTVDELARRTVGQRDAALLQFRTQVFGPRVVSVTNCPACGLAIELDFETSEITAATAVEIPDHLEVAMLGYRVRFRLPNSLDLLAAEQAASVDDARELMLTRCLLSAEGAGTPCAARDLPPEVAAAIAKQMSETDPLADLQLRSDCSQCGASWLAPFDIVSFFWTELSAWARRLLREVHLLASAYGWRESEILALGSVRRGIYLEMLE